MTTSNNGKTLALVILVVLLLLLAFRVLYVLPFGLFPGLTHAVREASRSFWDIRGHGFFNFVSLTASLALLVLWIFVIIWVYRDAERRGMNGILWALLVLIGSVIGLIIYLIIRSESTARRRQEGSEKCPNCGKEVAAGFMYCPHCGASLRLVCPNCHKPVDKSWKVCPNCGTSLGPDKPQQAI